ncbi:UvrD-helicase domain-containing protein [Tepidibacter hydrothermalis]|uniref:DNA 3'-5' helicase n=1 Tax=Tepidibacter hydrothermalis TaxID=3036126 RepID=A0ABY8EEE3_9FIRM|nr:UvrD-helicase domain-containing protein [Tepidibacter hydrothermalis]WFD11321.1 UvrD-helicase domain-containing protein [Tepidibacter hydrothermalis]
MIQLLPSTFSEFKKLSTIRLIEKLISEGREAHIITSGEQYEFIEKQIEERQLRSLIKVYKSEQNVPDKTCNGALNENQYKFINKWVKDFNTEQYQALQYAKIENIQINASAGTGKTTLVIRIIYELLITGKVKPEEMIITTFTNNSTEDIKNRLYELFYKRWQVSHNAKCRELIENFYKIKIVTLDSYNKELLGKLGGQFGCSKNLKVANEKIILKNIITKKLREYLDLNKITFTKLGMGEVDLIKLINIFISHNKFNVRDISNFILYESNDDERVKAVCKLLYNVSTNVICEIDNIYIRKDKIILKDVEYKLNEIFNYGFTTKEKIGRIKYIFVDECQDTNLLQFNILKKLKDSTNAKIIAVGDPNQAIYGFRGANPESMEMFEKIADQKIELKKNYRTQKNILDKIDEIFSTLIGKEFVNPVVTKDSGGVIEKITYDRYDSFKDIVRKVKENLPDIEKARRDNEGKENLKDRISILVRTNSKGREIADRLKEEISCTFNNGGNLYRSKAARELLILIRYLLMPDNLLYKLQVLNTSYLNWDYGKFNCKELEKLDTAYVDNLLLDFNNYLKTIQNRTPFGKICEIIATQNPSKGIESYQQDLNLILDRFIKNSKVSSLVDLDIFLTFKMIHDREEQDSHQKKAEDLVVVNTMHSAKGLEFHTVIMLADDNYRIDEERKELINIFFQKYTGKVGIKYKEKIRNKFFTDILEIEQEKIRRDEINLLYVGMTRSIEKLVVITNNNTKKYTYGELLKKGGF